MSVAYLCLVCISGLYGISSPSTSRGHSAFVTLNLAPLRSAFSQLPRISHQRPKNSAVRIVA